MSSLQFENTFFEEPLDTLEEVHLPTNVEVDPYDLLVLVLFSQRRVRLSSEV